MPGLTSLPLNLSEILEARRGPLRELEIWALLCQCAEALQDLILKGEALGENVFRLMITPNTLLVRDNGTILLAENAQSPHGSLYMAPEYDPRSQHLISEAVFEKMFVHCLGRTLQVASEFGLQENEILGISYDLDSLLQAMSEKNATARLSLMQILEACSLQASQHPDKLPHSLVLSRLYKSVLTGYHKQSSFNDSNYGSENSHDTVMSHKPGRARRPRPQVRHRHLRRRRRQGSTSSASSRESRSRSRSRSPDRPAGSQTEYRAGEPDVAESHVSPDARLTPAHGMMNAASSSQLLNTSMTSNSSELSTLERRRQVPQYSAASSVQGLLGLRQGSPAYQKYIKLKERQLRLRQAKSGQASGALNDIRSRVMTPPLMSVEMMDNMSETHSMASLMSYTLGSYRPYLYADLGSEAGLHIASEQGASSASQVSLLFAGMDYGQPMRAQAVPINVKQAIPEQLVHQATMIDATTQAEQEPMQAQQVPISAHEMPQVTEKSAKSQGMPDELVSSYGTIRDFEGPEFVHNMQKPAVSVMVPFQGDAEKKRLVTVAHLTGQSYNVVVNPSFTGRQLFDMVIPFLDLDDFYFFGLAYIFEGEQRFIEADTKLHKVAPVGWKEGPKGHQSHITFILNVRVKFYPEALTDFRHLSSRHMLYLQLRRDIVGERFTTDPDVLYKLAGLALQAEYGDYTKERAGATGSLERTDSVPQPYFTAEYYVPGSLLKQAGATMVYTKVTRRHKASAGLATLQAELEFITCVQSLPEYGIHFYKLMKTKTGSESPVWLGLSRQNLTVAEPSVSGVRTITQRHQWENIHNIDFSKRRFSFRPKVEGAKGKAPRISFYTNSFRKGRYMLQFLKEQHQFKIPVKSHPPSELGRATEQISEQVAPLLDSGIEESTVREEAPVSQAAINSFQQHLSDNCDDNDDLEEDWSVPIRRPVVPPVRYRSPPPYQAPAMAQILGGDGVFPGTEVSSLHASLTDLHGSEFDRDQLRALIDINSTNQCLECAPANNKNADGVAAPPYLPPDSDFLAPGRRIFEVTLAKEEGHGVGITIVGGETTSSLDLGIFVKSVVPGGPAERDGRISCGDRLIAIGGTSLEGKQHHEAVAMIRDSGPTVTFLVSQVRPPGTVKKRRSPVQDANFEKKLRDSMAEYKSGNFFASGGKDSFDDFLTKSLQNEQVNETFLNFDDFVNSKHKAVSITGSDIECNSDEENYPLEPLFPDPNTVRSLQVEASTQNISGTGPSLRQKQKTQPHNVDEARMILNQGSSHPRSSSPCGPASKIESHLVPAEATLLKLSSPPMYGEHDAESYDAGGIQVIDLQGDEELAKELMKESQDWQREDDIPNLMSYPNAHLTLEEQEDLHILGDLAALEADGSSSDSDFDSAIQKTIEGPCSKINPSSKSINSSGPIVFTAPEKDKSSDQVSPTDVIYEVILEKDFGIVVEVAPQQNLQGTIEDCVVIKEILDNSPAQRGGILAPGDKILEVAGQSVEGQDSRGVQELLDSAPYLTTMKIVRSKAKDMSLNRKGLDGSEWKVNNREVEKDLEEDVQRQRDTNLESPLTALIPKAPTESTPPLGEELQIVPPPPPLALGLDAASDSNTQSDVDSDVLDSSRSEVSHREADTIAVHHQMAASKSRPEKASDHVDNFWLEDAEKRDDVSTTTDTLKLEDSSEFDAKLDELKEELDRQLAREMDSPNLPSHSSGSSSADSVARSPRKLVASLEGRQDEDEEKEEEEHDDDDDVVVTMYGDQPVRDFPVAAKRLKDKEKLLEEDVMDPYEPVLLSVSLKRQKTGFGFTVAGGVNTGGCYVKQLVAEPAITDGRLRPGDKILQVNGQDTTSMGHVETVTLLRKVTDVAHLKLLRFPSTMETQQRIEAAQAQAELASSVHQTNLQKSDAPDRLETQPEGQQTLSAPKVVIQEHEDEKAREGDAARAYPNVDFGKKAESEQAGVFRVELSRPATSWAMLGIVLAEREADQGEGSQALVYVKRIKDGGLASRAGGLQKGDLILQVNGMSFIGMPAHQAVKCLREAGQKIVLTISRPERDDAEDEDDDEASDQEEGHDTDDNGDGMTIVVEQVETPSQGRPPSRVSDQYDSSRKAKTDVPVILSDTWLNDLPLMRMAIEQPEENTRGILQTLAELVESGEPSDTFKSLRQLPATAPCNEGQLQENKYKNRYRNVLPYDFNRVKLSRRDDSMNYINASYVDMPLTDYTGNVNSVGPTEDAVLRAVGGNTDRASEDNPAKDQMTGECNNDSDQQCLKYIACQGPLESTVSDLWLLVWQEKVHVIAMLTQTYESGKMKCFPYWPTDKDEALSVDDGALVVKLVRSYSLADLDVVQVVIEEPSTDEWQEVVILQHKGWPDHGAPDTALPLLKLLQVMHLLENGSPPVIHCSAGVGRTGALIAVDVALACIEHGYKFNFSDIVSKLRSQRQGMVQTTDQYLFCYTACMEALLSMES